jgi:hypothetical protein
MSCRDSLLRVRVEKLAHEVVQKAAVSLSQIPECLMHLIKPDLQEIIPGINLIKLLSSGQHHGTQESQTYRKYLRFVDVFVYVDLAPIVDTLNLFRRYDA